ncbi:MAG: bifunctional aldolase/short-chain dehydrogenase [Alphaproteobacteria bacterium]|nr:bifunctional aldolase/short-chain dehydrogenase [Alphaproteobacteria bacterium]
MVQSLWNDDQAQEIARDAGANPADQDLALEVYASRLIGSNPALVQHGGGNTSCKATRRDLFGREIEVLHIKGSGWDLGNIEAEGMPAVRLDPLLKLRALDRLSDEDMVNAVRGTLLNSSAPNPSVEVLLHAYLPHKFINHTHATVMLALADLPNAAKVVREIFGDRIACVPFFMPGFALAKAAAKVAEAHPEAEGLLLLKHGHFAFAQEAKQAYERIIEHTNMAERWLENTRGTPVKKPSTTRAPAPSAASDILPLLRGILGQANAEFSGNIDAPMPVMDLRAGANVQEFLARPDIDTLATRGVATPDHVIRTKNRPLVLHTADIAGGPDAIKRAVDAYIDNYKAYFTPNAARFPEGKTMLNPAPTLAWIEGLGLVGMGLDAKAAAIAADQAQQGIVAMAYGEDCGGFHPVGEAEIFDMEYWSLEQAKLGKAKPPALAGRVVLITGGAGAIGLATAKAFAAKGADIFLVDLDEAALAQALDTLGAKRHAGAALDITEEDAATRAINACIERFGGLDILVSNAGAAWSGAMKDMDDALLRKSFELNFFAHQKFASAAARLFAIQGHGGQILFNVSKQAVNPGKNFGAYGLPKAATFFLLRQLALELGAAGVRVNGINADRIRSGLLDDAFIKERARARGIDEATYMAGNLLNREVEASHVADAFVTLALSPRTTAHVMTVDGGNIEAALR